MRIEVLCLIAAGLLAVAPIAAQTPRKDDAEAAQQYQHCMALARSSPQEAWQEAVAWSSMAGGDPAHHCAAVALISMRQFEDGATKLEALAEQSDAEPRLRAGMMAQAGLAWLLAKQPDRAIAIQSKALALMPGAPDLLVDRAQAQVDAQNFQAALQDLDMALQAAPDHSDTLTFRASVKRALLDQDGARGDIAAALKLDDHNQDAWLEDGVELGLAGDQDGAITAWRKVLELAPRSDAADLARRYLAQLGVNAPTAAQEQ